MFTFPEPADSGHLQRFFCPRHGVVLQYLDLSSKERSPKEQVEIDCRKCPFFCACRHQELKKDLS